MPLTAPAGVISNAEQLLRVTLADCDEFRTWTSTLNQTDALARIYTDALPPPASDADSHTLAALEDLRPFALISTDDRNGYSVRRNAAPRGYVQSGSLLIWFEQDIAPANADDPAEISRLFKNTIGKIIRPGGAESGLLDLAYQSGYLAIDEVLLVDGPHRSNEDDVATQGDYVHLVLQIEWGRNR